MFLENGRRDWAFTLRVFSSMEPDTRYQLGSQLYIALMKNYPSISNFSKTVKIMQKIEGNNIYESCGFL